MIRLNEMFAKVQSLLRNDKGATMIEYALMAGFIAAIAAAAVSVLGGAVTTAFTNTVGVFP